MNRRYRLFERLGTGGMGDVHRAYDRLSGQYVALKRVLLDQNATVLTEDNLRLTHEFKILASLRHPNIINVLDYGFDETGLPYYTMEYLEGHQDILKAAETLAEEEKIDLLIQLLQGLDYLHRRGLLHRDLKPSNVLVTGGVVRLIDFGLAAKWENAPDMAGTIAYMPPEVFTGMGALAETDLYGVGLIAYEMLTGHPTYDLEQAPRALISDILNVQPDTSPIPQHLRPLIERLLAKFPDDRYESATRVIQTIHHIYDRTIPLRTTAMLDSHLKSVAFVGREKPVNLLWDALNRLITEQSGSTWLVGGESGVGKSRLLEEIRIQGLVEGIPALVGQAIDERAIPYQLWIDVLPHLLLRTEVSDIEAAVLKPIVPRVGDILGREVGEVPRDIDGQFILHETILNLFRRHEEPLLLILEDLHWADLDVLHRLLEIAPNLPLMIAASYRDEEMPDLPSELPSMTQIKLDRLDLDGVADLSRAMIGEAGERPGVLELLQNETEGNAFFIVEAVRMLAEDAGELYSVGHKTLPSSIMTLGIEAVLKRRLQRIPYHFHELLELAAVQGRVLDITTLHSIRGMDIDDFLRAGVDAAVFEVSDDHYRFAHDKLREKVLTDLPTALKAQHHQAIAEILVELHHDNLEERAVEIAHHYEKAYQNGIEGIEDEVGWSLLLAGRCLAHAFENLLAIDYFSRALELVDHSQHRFEVLSERSAVYALIGDRDAQAQDLTDMAAMARHPAQLAHVHLSWAYYYFDMSDYPLVIKHAQSAVEYAQTAGGTIQEAKALTQWAFTLNSLGQVDKAFELVDRARRLIEHTDDMLTRARVYSVLARVWEERGDFELQEFYLHEASTIYEDKGDIRGQARSINTLALIVSRQGHYEGEYNYYVQALDLFRQIGDKDWEVNLLGNLGVWYTERDDVEIAGPYFEDALELARQLGDDDAVAWTLLEQGHLLFSEGQYTRAARNFDLSAEMYRDLGRTVPYGHALVSAGLLAIRTGQLEKGNAYLDQSKSLETPWVDWYRLRGYAEHALLTGNAELALDLLNEAASMDNPDLYKEAFQHHYFSMALTDLRQTGLARQHAEQARLQFKKGGRPAHAIEALVSSIALGRVNFIDEVLDYLRERPAVNGAHYPFRVYAILYESLATVDDSRADDVLVRGHSQLMALAATIEDADSRQKFLTNIPYHQTILSAIKV